MSRFISKMIQDTYNCRPIVSRAGSIERCRFQWAWMTPNPDFKVTPLFNAEYLRNGTRYRHSYNDILIGINAFLKNAISNDLEWLSEIFNDTKHRAVSLWLLSFLFLENVVPLLLSYCDHWRRRKVISDKKSAAVAADASGFIGLTRRTNVSKPGRRATITYIRIVLMSFDVPRRRRRAIRRRSIPQRTTAKYIIAWLRRARTLRVFNKQFALWYAANDEDTMAVPSSSSISSSSSTLRV